AATVFTILVACMLIWYLRQPIGEIIERRIVRRLGGPAQQIVHQLATFLTDKPVRAKWFQVLREWCVILFLRSPGLVLMYSATNDSLVMPSYPLDPASAEIFKFIQVGLAIFNPHADGAAAVRGDDLRHLDLPVPLGLDGRHLCD